jgi:hypothetical protein
MEGEDVKGWLPLTIGLLAVVVGATWTAQGLGYVGGSLLTGDRAWAVIGPIVVLLGVVSLRFGLRARTGARS